MLGYEASHLMPPRFFLLNAHVYAILDSQTGSVRTHNTLMSDPAPPIIHRPL